MRNEQRGRKMGPRRAAGAPRVLHIVDNSHQDQKTEANREQRNYGSWMHDVPPPSSVDVQERRSGSRSSPEVMGNLDSD